MRLFQGVAASIAFSALMAAGATCAGAEDEPLGVRLVNQMNALYGQHAGVRANHAKGAVFEGMFTPARGADTLSSAVFLKGAPTPLVIRFSNAGGVPDAPDTHPSTDRVRGMAIKFRLPDGSEQDIVCISANGFPVATGEDFLALLQAVGASGPDVPKPTLVEKFLSTHPAASAFVTTPRPVAVSYGTPPFFCVNPVKFTTAPGTTQFGRYRIVPENGPAYLTDTEAAKRLPKSPPDKRR